MAAIKTYLCQGTMHGLNKWLPHSSTSHAMDSFHVTARPVLFVPRQREGGSEFATIQGGNLLISDWVPDFMITK